ncbi:MAG: class II fructose-bisphosphate aldolase [Lawsonibacter sp.]|jgi:ketose-bisphosphate aldolase|nr:class II fructose-bisphosphate aldolase [Lawsonibacter sp.]
MNGNDLKRLLAQAEKGGYALNAFNCTDVWDVSAIISAAEELNAPVMIAIHQENFSQLPLEVYGVFVQHMAGAAKVPVILHLDHCTDAALCKAAVDCGFPSIMLDASFRPLEENIAAVRDVVDYAHARGSVVEGEIGRIKGQGYEGGYNGEGYLAQVEDCVRIVAETGVDTLAVGIGTAHGYYEGQPCLSFDRLAEIHRAVDIPLVLHGGTGLSREDVRRCIELGIRKVNVGTCITSTYMNSMKAQLERHGENAFIMDLIEPVRNEIRGAAQEWIKTCMGDQKAQ